MGRHLPGRQFRDPSWPGGRHPLLAWRPPDLHLLRGLPQDAVRVQLRLLAVAVGTENSSSWFSGSVSRLELEKMLPNLGAVGLSYEMSKRPGDDRNGRC